MDTVCVSIVFNVKRFHVNVITLINYGKVMIAAIDFFLFNILFCDRLIFQCE